MRWRSVLMAVILCGTAGTSGCSSARWISVGPEGGVVAIHDNTNSWPTYNRDRAMKLIQERYPQGYEIVQEEEVVTGQTSHTNSNTDTRKAPAVMVAPGIAIPLGETQQNTVQTTHYSDVTEWRITCRPKR